MRKLSRRAPQQDDRERRKKLWLDPVLADLNTSQAREMAAKYRISLRLAGQIAGLIVNLDSFLDEGFIYGSCAGLAVHIKNENGVATSGRQVRRGIVFISARGHLRIERRAGTSNLLFPIYRRGDTPDVMSSPPEHDGRTPRTSCPPNPIIKPVSETYSPHIPPSCENGAVVRLTERTAKRSEAARDQTAIKGPELIQYELASRLGEGDIERGYLILLSLSDSERDQLTAITRVGKLTDVELAKARAAVEQTRDI